MKFLVGVNEVENLARIKNILQIEFGSEVTAISSVEEVRDKLCEDKYQIIILDYRLIDESIINHLHELKESEVESVLIFQLDQFDEWMPSESLVAVADAFIIKTQGYAKLLPLIIKKALEKNELKRNMGLLCKELEQLSKYAYFARMTPGIAHNINSPLASIMGRVQLFIQREEKRKEELLARKETMTIEEYEKEINRSEKNIRDLKSISESAGKISNIIKNMTLKYNNEQNESVVYLNLTELLKEELNFLEADMFFKHDVIKEYYFAESLPYIKGVYLDFSQSLMGILQNILNALRNAEKRKIYISTSSNAQSINITFSHTGNHLDEREISILKSFPQLPGIKQKNALELLKPYNAYLSCYGCSGDSTVTLIFPLKN